MQTTRTTVSIPNELHASARRRARERGTTMSQVVEAALRRELAAAETRAAPPIPVFTRGTGPLAGVDLTSSRALMRAVDESSTSTGGDEPADAGRQRGPGGAPR